MSDITDAAGDLKRHKKACIRCRSGRRCPEAKLISKEIVTAIRKRVKP